MADSFIGSQAQHIQLNAGNVLAIMLLSVLANVFTAWSTNALARTNIPVLSQLAIGGHYATHAA